MCEPRCSLVNAKGEEGDLVFDWGSQQFAPVAKSTAQTSFGVSGATRLEGEQRNLGDPQRIKRRWPISRKAKWPVKAAGVRQAHSSYELKDITTLRSEGA